MKLSVSVTFFGNKKTRRRAAGGVFEDSGDQVKPDPD